MGFFTTLNYSSCNEDWRTERRALAIGPGDRVLCVTGSGDRPLHLLLDDPGSVEAIDAGLAQNQLLALKIAAMRALPYEQYVRLLGLRPERGRKRLELLERALGHLGPDAREFWLARTGMIRSGVLYEGRFERYYRAVSRLAGLLRGPVIHRLFEAASIEEQCRVVANEWDRPWWRLTYRLMCSRAWSRIFLRDPAFYAHVDPRMSIGDYVYDRMLGSLRLHLARRNFMLSLILRGRLAEEDLPPYLEEPSFETLRARLDRIRARTADLIAHLESVPAGSYTRFSLSDVPSYLGQADFERLLRAMLHAAAPGARFCIRQFLSAQEIPASIAARIEREPGLEAELEREDRAFAYRFIVGTVREAMTG